LDAASSADCAEELRGSLVGLLGKLELGLGIGELSAIDGTVEGEERRALLDWLAFLEMDLLETTRNLGADRHGLIGEQRADGGHLLAQGSGEDLGGLDLHHVVLLVALRRGGRASQGEAGGQKPASYAPLA
jgi:hypothetical protein